MNDAAVAAVAARLRQLGMKADVPEGRVARAVHQVASERGATEAEALRLPLIDEVVELLAIHESWFFREPRQLTALAQHILPTLPDPVHVWCAGCARGEEAWSVAMLLAEHRGLKGNWRVTATDLSGRAVEAARRGVYPTSRLRGLSTERRSRFVQRADEEWAIVPALRANVEFLQHNVVTQRPPMASCQVVLCRNVLIYLHESGVRRALESLGQAIGTEGWMLVGAAESLWGVTEEFNIVRLPGAFAYRKTGAPPGPVPPPPSPPRWRGRDTQAVSAPPTHELLALAAAASAAGRHDDAVRAYRQAAYLDPDLLEAHAGLAASLAATGDEQGSARARAVAERLRRRR